MEKECNECKNPGKLSDFEIGSVIVGFSILSLSIYGAVTLIQKIISLF